MKRIEFTGAAGVGKSTLFSKLLEKRVERSSWYTPKEALINTVKENFKSKHPFNRRGLIQYNISPQYHEKWSREILASYKWKIYKSSLPSYNSWINFFIEAYNENKTHPASAKMEHFNLFFSQIEELSTLSYFNFKDKIIYEEGLLQHNPGITELTSFQQIKYSEENKFQLPVAVVYCKLSVEENYKRRKNRIAQGKGTQNEREKSDKDLLDLCTRMNDRISRRVEVLKAIGIPILEVDMSSDLSKNVEKVNSFINGI